MDLFKACLVVHTFMINRRLSREAFLTIMKCVSNEIHQACLSLNVYLRREANECVSDNSCLKKAIYSHEQLFW